MPIRLSSNPRRVSTVALGGVAVVLMVVVGCTRVVTGTSAPDTVGAPAYRTSVSSSIAESSSSSRSQESSREAAATSAAIQTACNTYFANSVAMVDGVNGYIDAFNANNRPSPDAAVTALNTGATQISGVVTNMVPQNLQDALTEVVNAATSMATGLSNKVSASDFNAASHRFNDAKTKADTVCNAS